jgi:hypothetical protein
LGVLEMVAAARGLGGGQGNEKQPLTAELATEKDGNAIPQELQGVYLPNSKPAESITEYFERRYQELSSKQKSTQDKGKSSILTYHLEVAQPMLLALVSPDLTEKNLSIHQHGVAWFKSLCDVLKNGRGAHLVVIDGKIWQQEKETGSFPKRVGKGVL